MCLHHNKSRLNSVDGSASVDPPPGINHIRCWSGSDTVGLPHATHPLRLATSCYDPLRPATMRIRVLCERSHQSQHTITKICQMTTLFFLNIECSIKIKSEISAAVINNPLEVARCSVGQVGRPPRGLRSRITSLDDKGSIRRRFFRIACNLFVTRLRFPFLDLVWKHKINNAMVTFIFHH